MTIEEQRAACARFRGWRKAEAEFSDNNFWLIPNADGKTALVGPRLADYHPDGNDPASREQLEAIKQQLRDIKIGYEVRYSALWKEFICKVDQGVGFVRTRSDINEGSALVAAVAEMERSKR